jgi:ketose-bisphosphate aldolase
MKLKDVLNKRLVFAINIDNYLIFKALISAVEKTNSPVIAQVSESEAEFWGLDNFYQMVKFQKTKGLPIFTNIDHGNKMDTIDKAINLGFDMVHIDASHKPWQANIKLSRSVTKKAHPKGILVETEPQAKLTDPEKVSEFVYKTKTDILAVFVGNKHGYDPKIEEKLDLDRLEKIKNNADCFIALHGGSGVRKQDFNKAVKNKLINKVNINSHLRYIYKTTFSKELKTNKSMKYYELAEKTVQSLEKEIINLFSQSQR